MPAITFTLNALPGKDSKSLRFEPRNAPWVNTSGQVVTPDGFGALYPRNTAQSVTLDTGPWRVRIGVDWFAFDVPAGGGDLKDLILFGVPATAPASTITAAVNAYLASHPNGLLTQAVADASYAPVSGAGSPAAAVTLAAAHADSGDAATLTTATGRAIAFAIALG
ncbi:hypothetical protein [Gordonia sp. N1V]|uniref:hypothetical protein n=1 Tax=Gordonia sp. N1V TaxID=3034163 RepID=UPI0023E25483|nr:hypothetical protein [Gordonia sp. N1V]MDF3280500.1 hypothetical protein [Gordonia sp. N1V]